jgi:hypothetical protein
MTAIMVATAHAALEMNRKTLNLLKKLDFKYMPPAPFVRLHLPIEPIQIPQMVHCN